jgi:competence protein ComEC
MGKLYILSVGCGNFTVIQSKHSTVLIDCGDDNQSGKRFINLLPENHRIDAVFITHQHFDHFRNLDYLINEGHHVDWLIYSPYIRKSNDKSVNELEWQTFLKYKDILEDYGTKMLSPFRQENVADPFLEIDEMKFHIIGPSRLLNLGNNRELHDVSLVILAELGKIKCIFPGDASVINLNRIAANHQLPKVDILLASHHGSKKGADASFVRKCDPDTIVISTQAGTRHQFPHSEAVQIYRENPNRKISRTDINGGSNGYLDFDW